METLPAREETEAIYEPGPREQVKVVGRPSISNAADVAKHCGDIQGADREHAVAFFLDVRHRIIGDRWIVGIGSICGVDVSPREVLREGLKRNAVAFILAHNHPSGDPEPSRQDYDLTTRIYKAGELIGLRLIDHIVVSDAGHVSIASRGYC